MNRSTETKILIEKRNTEIRDVFPKVFKVENFNVFKASEVVSEMYFLSANTIRQIVYRHGHYKSKKIKSRNSI